MILEAPDVSSVLSETVQLDRCPVCQQTGARSWRMLKGWNLDRCDQCGMIYVNPCPTEAALQVAYSLPKDAYDRYFQTGYINSHKILGGTAAWQLANAHQYLETIEQQLPGRGRILDLGCGPGVFLDAAKSRGWETAGVDPGDWRESAEKDRELSIVRTSLFDAPLEPASFDAVFMGSVLEHLHEPRRYLEALFDLLKPGGIIYVVGLPNIKSWTIQLGIDRWIGNHPPLHLVYFSRRTVRQLFENAGFRQVRVRSYGMSETVLEAIFNRRKEAYTGHYASYVADNTSLTSLVLRPIRWAAYTFFDWAGIGSVLAVTARKP